MSISHTENRTPKGSEQPSYLFAERMEGPRWCYSLGITARGEGRGNTDCTELNEDPLSSRRKRITPFWRWTNWGMGSLNVLCNRHSFIEVSLTKLYIFKVYNIIIWYMCTLSKWLPQTNTSIPLYSYHFLVCENTEDLLPQQISNMQYSIIIYSLHAIHCVSRSYSPYNWKLYS